MHPLRQKIARLRRQARRLIVAHGLACVVLSLLGGLLLLGGLDYLTRFQDRGVRILATLAWVAAAAWTVYRFLWPAVMQRSTDIEVAQRVEARFPELTDRLSSAIDFLQQPEDQPAAGSPELRRAVIAQTTADIDNLRWTNAIDRRPTARVCLAVLCMGLVATVIVLVNPRTALVALERLAMPWSDAAWPRQHELAFKRVVTRVAVGQDFEVELIDRHGTPPDDARIVYRYPANGQPGELQQEKFVSIGGALVARKESVVRPFEYKATGGDDNTMPWIAVELVEPPAVESMAITLNPPLYTGWAPSPSERRIQALRGTHVTLAGKTTKPIASAIVQHENSQAIPLRVTDDGHGFSLDAGAAPAWVIDQSGKYWIELSDTEGLIGGADDRWDIRAISDEPPHVSLDRPVGTLFVTASAVIPIKVTVRDDLAIHRIALHYLRSDQSDAGEQILELFAGPQEVARSEKAESADQRSRGDAQTINYAWDLGPMTLATGVQLTITASATDYRPQTGMSQAVRIVVLASDEFEDRIASRQAAILAEIARILKAQQETRATTKGLLTQAERARQFRRQDADGAHTVELAQRQIRRSLASPSEGVLAQSVALLDELAANRIDSPETLRRIERVGREVRRLNDDELATIEQELVALVKNSQIALDEPSQSSESIGRLAASLGTAVAGQDKVIASLESMLDELSEWNDYRTIVRDIAELKREQSNLQQDTRKQQSGSLGKDFKDLTPQQQADLQKFSELQAEFARRFDKLQQRMEQVNAELQQATPLAAESLVEAVEMARREGIGSHMRDSARALEANRLGQAIEQQQWVDAKLGELLDILANRREQELSRLVKKLRAAEAQLVDLRRQQQGLRKSIKDVHARLDASKGNSAEQEKLRRELQRLMGQQRKLEQESQRLARELERLRAQQAADRLAAAGAKMQSGSQAGDRGESDKAADLADQAKGDLDEAQRELADQRRRAEQDLANEQLATIQHALEGIAGRQEAALQETQRLHLLRQSQGTLRGDQARSLEDLARNESQLKDEANSLAEKVAAAEVFQLALRSAAEHIGRAAEMLARGETGGDTQSAERLALMRLRQLLAALKEDQSAANDNQDQPPGGDGGAGGPQNNKPPPILHGLAELKLLIVMQQDVNRRTIELQGQIGARSATDAEQSELEMLAGEQGRIADLVAKMAADAAKARAAEATDPEDNPDSLPDVRSDKQEPGSKRNADTKSDEQQLEDLLLDK